MRHVLGLGDPAMPGEFVRDGVTFTIHFLVSGEGKGRIDGHLGVISKLLESWIKTGGKLRPDTVPEMINVRDTA